MKLLNRALAVVRALLGVDENNGDKALSRSAAIQLQIEGLELQRSVAEDLGEYASLPIIDEQLAEFRRDRDVFLVQEEEEAERLRTREMNPARAPVLTPVPVSWLLIDKGDAAKKSPQGGSDAGD